MRDGLSILCSGAGDESTRGNDSSDGRTDHMDTSGGDFADQSAADAAEEEAI